MTAAEKLHEMIDTFADKAKADTIRDILITLKDSVTSADSDEIKGLKAAIEIISTNY